MTDEKLFDQTARDSAKRRNRVTRLERYVLAVAAGTGQQLVQAMPTHDYAAYIVELANAILTKVEALEAQV
jgi:hypothetical protein